VKISEGLLIMNRKTLATALLAGLALICPARAAVVFSNIPGVPDGDRSLIPDAQFQSFSTGAGGFSLTDVMLLLSGGGADTNFFSVDLYADSSTSPGSLLFHIGSKVDNTLTISCNCIYDFPTAPFALSANTRYWIGLSTTDGSGVDWSIEGGFVTPPGDVGVAGEFHDDTGIVGPDYSGSGFLEAFQMVVTDSPTTTSGVPEPSTLVLGAAGLLSLIVLRRRTKRA
jgi:hypothetical protein